jgi:ABC-type dipeptide/oligopeptide/nickel transport system ATPase component
MTRKIIAMVGEPATGKSTIMKAFIAAVKTPWTERQDVQLVPTTYNQDLDLHIIGLYAPEEPFPGTDRLSMAVQPQAVKFIEETKSNILFEGDQPDTDFKLWFIVADRVIIEHRHVSRGDTQTETFKKGRQTKIENLMSNMVLMGYSETIGHHTPTDTKIIVDRLITEFT